jgi:metacaspase-1
MAKRALLIGINKYQMAGADLRGCVNDVKALGAALVEFHGFTTGDIAVLTDGDATKKAMEAGIRKLVRGAKKGDVVLLHYSGHGSNVPDDDKDEADGRDEILCPTDLDWNNPLRDDWLRTTFDGLRAGVSFTVIMDCCHSGTNTRAILPPDAPVKERYLPSPWGLAAVESGRSLPKKVTSELRRAPRAARKAKDIVNAELPEVLITGCRDTQTSADAFINGAYAGALTFALVEAIRQSKGRLTYRELHDRASAVLKKRKFEQVPQLEGRAASFDRPLLSV